LSLVAPLALVLVWASKVVGIVVEASMAALIGRHHKDCCSQTDCRHRVVEETFQEILGVLI